MRKKSPAFWGVLIVAFVVVTGGAVILGKSDSGQIDVSSAIQNSNQARQEAGGSSDSDTQTIPEVFRNKTNGGLVPQENQPEPAVIEVPVVTTTEATTTEEQISTEDEAVESEVVTEGGTEVE